MCDDDKMPYVSPEEENLIILDGTGHPFEWQPTISAAWHATFALGSREPTRLDVITAFIIGYNQGAADQELRAPGTRPRS
jgi:hypothetical protein